MINVLILEDDPIISLDIKAIVDDIDGFNSFIASNISDALKIIIENTQPSPNAPQGTGFTNAGKNNKLNQQK